MVLALRCPKHEGLLKPYTLNIFPLAPAMLKVFEATPRGGSGVPM